MPVSLFSIHYFLWYGALTSMSGYESVYAQQYTNASTLQYGYLNAVLPFITVFVTPLLCSRADRFRSHRNYFTLSLIATTTAFALYGLLPLVLPSQGLIKLPADARLSQADSNGLLWTPWVAYCLISLVCDIAGAINTCLSDSFAVLQAEDRDLSFGWIIVWGTFGWAAGAMVLSFINAWDALPRLVPGLLYGTLLLAIDALIVTFWNKPEDFKLNMLSAEAAFALTGSISSKHRDPNDYMPRNESARINLGPIKADELASTKLRRCIVRSPLLITDNVVISDQKTITNALEKNGLQDNGRADFPLSRAPSVVKSQTSPINSTLSATSKTDTRPHQHQHILRPTPAQKAKEEEGMGVAKNKSAAESCGVASRQVVLKHLEAPIQMPSFTTQLIILSLIMRKRKTLIRYFFLFITSGFFMSMQWNYFFLYLDIIYHENFETITALSTVGQSMLGELPFFILSRSFINFFGHSHTLSISFITIGIRFMLYIYLLPFVSMYYVFVADFLQGPNYGLFYVVMTEVGLEYSYCDNTVIESICRSGKLGRNNQKQIDAIRLSMRSTVQSVAYACYEGVGVGLGSLVGGLILSGLDDSKSAADKLRLFRALWLSMAVGALVVGFGNIIFEYVFPQRSELYETSDARDFVVGRKGTTNNTTVTALPKPSSELSSKACNTKTGDI